MSYKYEKNIELTEEGSSHRREVETIPPSSKNHCTVTTHKQVVPVKSREPQHRHRSPSHAAGYSSDDGDNFEEWTTSKKKVNHKTRQVETRVSRQLLVEDGKVIADSGPQVTTRIKEDSTVEECEKEKAPKNKGRFEALENAPESGESSGRVLGEKKEIRKVTREVREENMQYHDERFKELTGHDVHRRAIQAPHELITITDKSHSQEQAPRGKMVHYSNKGKKYQDTDEILEVAKLAIDGSVTKEVKRTKHHQEESEDEKPDETGEAEALRNAPTVTRSSRRHVDYVNDFDDTSTPSCSEDEQPARSGTRRHQHSGNSKGHKSSRKEEEAFPRYEIDPLLNSLRDEDYRPASSGRYREHQPRKVDSDEEERMSSLRRSSAQRVPVTSGERQTPVEIPEEYRVNKSRLLSGRERSFSPTGKSHLSHRSSKSHRSHKEDASVQAHLTDEEEEKKSLRSSSSGANSHEKTTRHLQRQSTQNSRRNYYFGEHNNKQQHQARPKSPSTYSSSSSSLSDPKERMRKQGIRSRDSGFKSPVTEQQQIYSVSSKAKKNRAETVSPTPTNTSLGQRSVKTTTTTMSAGLADRPTRPVRHANPQRRSSRSPSPAQTYTKERQRAVGSTGGSRSKSGKGAKVSRTPSPFQKLARLFSPSSPKQTKPLAGR